MDASYDVKRKALKAFLSVLILDELEEKFDSASKKARYAWVSPWIRSRNTEGCYHKLLKEFLEVEQQTQYYENFLGMNDASFQYLLKLVAPHITKQDTIMRKAISAGERLAVTLRFLASGNDYHSLGRLFRIPHNTISNIVPEVCDAIYTALKNTYLKV